MDGWMDFRWSWTLPPVWSSVLADTNTSRRLFSTCFIGYQCHSEYSSKIKITISAFHCVREHCPAYFNNICMHPSRRHFWSGKSLFGRTPRAHDMLVPSTRTQLGRRSFHVAVPAVWNTLPSQLRSLFISSSSLVPDDVSGTEHSASPVLRRGTVCRRTFVLRQHCVVSKICSRLICFSIRFTQSST